MMRLNALVDRAYDRLTANDREMVDAVFRDLGAVKRMNSTELAAHLHVSRTTLARLLRKLGLDTFAEFKLLLAEEERTAAAVFDMEKVGAYYHEMIDELKKHDYEGACRMIYEAETVYLYGTGNEQKAIAEEFKRIFLILGKTCVDLFDFGEAETAAGRFGERDLFLAVSLSGQTPEALKVLRRVRETGIRTMSLTRWENNPLARLCGENLYVGTRTVNREEIQSYEMVAAFYILLDILSVRYLEYAAGRGEENRDD